MNDNSKQQPDERESTTNESDETENFVIQTFLRDIK